MSRKCIVHALQSALAALMSCGPAALAQAYPNKSIRVIVGFAPSGGT
jgi:tripartite-type tricarboxylate transporter receptor subunit TctC